MTDPSKVLIVAEAGVNHNGDLDLAKRLVDAAADAGADMVKFQTFIAERLVTSTAQKAEYQRVGKGDRETQKEMLRRLELTAAKHTELIEHCARRGIEFFSTAFDIESLDLLVRLGQRSFKIPSGEITNLPYLRHVGGFRKPVLLSTGMSTLEEIGAALVALEQAGTPRSLVTVLHCTSAYPTPMAQVNLRAMQTIGRTLGVAVGYSDHTVGIEVPIAAVAMGAKVVEKHFTLDRNMTGPDHAASLVPSELTAMVIGIRNIECALGDGTKRVLAIEAANQSVVRKSIVAGRPIKAGEKFTEANLTTKRPGTGVSPMQWDEMIGRISWRDFDADELIS